MCVCLRWITEINQEARVGGCREGVLDGSCKSVLDGCYEYNFLL